MERGPFYFILIALGAVLLILIARGRRSMGGRFVAVIACGIAVFLAVVILFQQIG